MQNLRICLVAVIAAVFFSTIAFAGPSVELTAEGLRAVGLTPGADAVWFGASIESFAMTPLLKRHAKIVRDDDRDGIVVFETPNLSRYALVFVVDSATAEHAVYRGQGVDGTQVEVTGNSWRSGIEQFDVTAETLHVLLVRPGIGAWATSAIDGSDNDGDSKRDLKFRLKVKDMQPLLGDGKPQGAVRRSDLLVLIEPHTLAYAARTAAE